MRTLTETDYMPHFRLHAAMKQIKNGLMISSGDRAILVTEKGSLKYYIYFQAFQLVERIVAPVYLDVNREIKQTLW